MLKAIIFDVDGVLVDSREAILDLYRVVLTKAGYPPPSRALALTCTHLPLLQAIEKLTGLTDKKEIQRIWEISHDPSLRDLSLLNFPAELEQVLEHLHKKYRLAIVTSRMRGSLETLFSVKKIRHFFDVIVTFDDYKNPKPHPEPLQVALEKLGLTPDEAIYVGDSPTDIEAAHAAGMRSIFISTNHHPQATGRVQEFQELLGILEMLNTNPV